MYYDDSTRRLNLLSGLVFGAALGAGLALLLLPEERLRSGGRIVVRAARGLGRTIDDVGGPGHGEDGDADDGGREDEDDADEVGARRRVTGATSPARQRAARLARRKFEL
jgi:hypothetical protein